MNTNNLPSDFVGSLGIEPGIKHPPTQLRKCGSGSYPSREISRVRRNLRWRCYQLSSSLSCRCLGLCCAQYKRLNLGQYPWKKGERDKKKPTKVVEESSLVSWSNQGTMTFFHFKLLHMFLSNLKFVTFLNNVRNPVLEH